MAAEIDPSPVLELPEELFGLIVAKVPLQNLFQLRMVCTQWNDKLHDASFLEKYLQLAKRAPLFVWLTENEFAAYSPDANSWHIWPNSWYLMEGSWFKVSGAAEGVVLAESRDGFDGSLHLANPMTRSQQKILGRPKFHSVHSSVLGVVNDESSGSYKVFAMDHGISSDEYLYENQGDLDDEEDDGRSHKLYVYDSRKDNWKVCGTWEKYEMPHVNLPTLHRGVMHCLIADHDLVETVYRVFRSEGDGAWLELGAPMPPELQFVHLFNWQGNLILVGGKGSQFHVSSVHIWQLDEEKNMWLQISTMPDDLLPPYVLRLLPLRFRCDNGGDYVCLTTFSNDAGHRRVMCNMATASWWELPELPSIPGKSTLKWDFRGSLYSFSFKPSFEKYP